MLWRLSFRLSYHSNTGAITAEPATDEERPAMPKLLYSPASPYSAKVRMAAAWLGLEIETETVNTNDEPALLIDSNPLGKIPTLILDDGASDALYVLMPMRV